MTDRERAVREAAVSLGKVGLKIGSLQCHPMVFMDIVNEPPPTVMVNWKSKYDMMAKPEITYCGIPLEQVI